MAAEPELRIPTLTDAVGNEASEASIDPEAPAESVSAETARPGFPPQLAASSVGNGRGDQIDKEAVVAELQTELAARTFALTDEIMRNAFAEMEAAVFEQVASRLRRELPEMIDSLLRDRLGVESDY